MLLAACSDGRTAQMLSQIDTLMNDHPDSALTMLDSLRLEKANWSKSLRMRFDLLEAKAQNKADVLFTTDSIAKEFTHYYDNHGTPNERMLAHYLLGCIYRDLGDSPRAIDAYLTATTQADTTAIDCDYNTLFRVYAQMAGLYHRQLLFSKEIEAGNQSSYYAFMANDTLSALLSLTKAACASILLNKWDSAEYQIKKIREQYLKSHHDQDVFQTSFVLLYMYVQDSNRLSEAKELIDEFETKSILFDEYHELPPSRRVYYYYKGKYYEGINKLDSAEYYYRKVYYSKMPFTSQNSMYGGLLNVFKKRHQADSIVKYAQLYCEVNDSSIAKKDQELTAQMAASFNYNLFQKEAMENEVKAHNTQNILTALLALFAIISIIIYLKWKGNKKKHEKLQAEFANATDEYNNNIHALHRLEDAQKAVINTIQDELNTANKNNQAMLSQLTSIKSINSHYEEEKQKLLHDNEELRQKISELQGKKIIQQQIEICQNFMKSKIAELVLNIAAQPSPMKLSESNWTELISTTTQFYPSLIYDLNHKGKATQREIRICILTCLGLRESDLCNLIDISSQQVTNSKSNINKKMFNDKAARTLYKNLAEYYGIYIL